MNHNEIIAQFMGWKIEGEYIWVPNSFPDNESMGETQFHVDDPFFSQYNFIVLVWNRTMDEFCLVDGVPIAWANFFERIKGLPAKFTIETRLPLLIEILTFLEKQK